MAKEVTTNEIMQFLQEHMVTHADLAQCKYDILDLMDRRQVETNQQFREIRTDIKEIKSDIFELKDDVAELKTDMKEVKSELRHANKRIDRGDNRTERLIGVLRNESIITKTEAQKVLAT